MNRFEYRGSDVYFLSLYVNRLMLLILYLYSFVCNEVYILEI